ncbi:hypothetical protein MKW98_030053 [Papaver atlanticum]|uniref:Uncharacterized protein n=1 Tax=Papaver atlanticum TaxID=357466 RepID=A0AAD4T4R7_9MAGN|nr:hypothetical protein MKW98_030053 [Papaver atlanticum]
MKVWKRFKKAGLLDEVSLEQKDGAALIERVSTLERELFEYQYNMGLLLIEKKEWISQYDEVREALAEAEECLKRDQSSHLISIFEVERREENLRNALGVKKQCIDDLEKSLREMRAECAETKYNADLKMTEAQDLVASLDEKSLQENEVQAREIKLQSERQSLNAEREINEEAIDKQREEMG